MNRIFKTDIPSELVERFFKLVGIASLNDFHWWPKTFLTPEICREFDLMLPELEPYYYDHKKFIITREMNPNRYVQILRQLAKAKGYVLQSQECRVKYLTKYKKTIHYRLNSSVIHIPEKEGNIFLVEFL